MSPLRARGDAPYLPGVKLLVLSALLTTVTQAAGTLEDFLWKMRLLVVTGDAAALRDLLAAAGPGLAERDIRIFFLSESGIDPALARQLRERLKVRPGIEEVFLLGKDGRTTLRWPAGEFTIPSLYTKIDAMPMRKSEMRGD